MLLNAILIQLFPAAGTPALAAAATPSVAVAVTAVHPLILHVFRHISPFVNPHPPTRSPPTSSVNKRFRNRWRCHRVEWVSLHPLVAQA